jgi:hypothetical protein
MQNFLVPGTLILDAQRAVAPALNTWNRLEPLPISSDLQVALQAAVADPLWLLCRQWQFLEFAGEDAGTPVQVQVAAEATALDRFLAGAPGTDAADAAARTRPLDTNRVPLEVQVEAEPIRALHPRLAAEAGQHALRLLLPAWPSSLRAGLRAAFITTYALELPSASESLAADETARQWWALAFGNALDGRKLAAALNPLRNATGQLATLPATPPIASAQRAATLKALQTWLAWYDSQVVEPLAPNAAWNPRRQEYAFAASGRSSSRGEITLVADEYADGQLDWSAVDVAPLSLAATPPAGTINLPPPPPSTTTKILTRPSLASPVEFAGKPADRYWEFEDAAVNFGVIGAGPTDLSRLLLVEFALVYGNDWFVVPLRVPVGSLYNITDLSVTDTFGVVTSIPRSRSFDGAAWSLFELGGRSASLTNRRVEPGLLLAPTLATRLDGAPLEQVALFRDEMANMVWGVERRVQGLSGAAYDRADEASRRAASQQIDGAAVAAELVYRLATDVPAHWLPYVPVPAAGNTPTHPVIELQRRAMLRSEADGSRKRMLPQGQLLAQGDRLEEEEVPREGVVVERAFQYARWFDGRALLWVGRRKTAGRGEGASGLRYDTISR